MLVPIDSIVISDKFEHLLPALHPFETETLKRSLEDEGWRESDPARIWNSTLIDGYNRFRLAQEIGIKEIPVKYMEFENELEVEIWMLRHQLGRRNVTDQLRAFLRSQIVVKMSELLGGTVAAVNALSAEPGQSVRTYYRNLRDARYVEKHGLTQEFLSGKLTSNQIVQKLKKPIVHTKAIQAQRSRDAFEGVVATAAERVLTAINNLKVLCNDVHLVFKNQGKDLADYAPEIASMGDKLGKEIEEAEMLQNLGEMK